jgi:hypothetical protein
MRNPTFENGAGSIGLVGRGHDDVVAAPLRAVEDDVVAAVCPPTSRRPRRATRANACASSSTGLLGQRVVHDQLLLITRAPFCAA